MNYCKYHPLEAATYSCSICGINQCDDCIDESAISRRILYRCFICGNETESLGETYKVEPFWRQLQPCFRYPLNASTITLIIGVSILSAIVFYLPFPFSILFYLALVGSLLKYGLSCLTNTAKGDFQAPDVQQAYSGGLGTAGSFIFMIILIMAGIYGANQLFGAALANIISFIFLVGFPAILIIYGLTEDVFEAVNPAKMLQLMITIGLPYGLLLAFIFIMLGSVSVINQLIGSEFSILSAILQSLVSNYYLIVMFHIMGYLIFQYQGKLGFSARSDDASRPQKTEQELLNAKIKVILKEGDYQQVNLLYKNAIKQYQNDKNLYQEYFEFLLATKNQQEISLFAANYLGLLMQTNRPQVCTVYKQVLALNPQYLPDTAELRLALAKVCWEAGEPKLAAKLIKDIHKIFPDFYHLDEAYELLAECFDDLPNMQEKAQKCRAFAKQLRLKKPKSQQKKSGEKASFSTSGTQQTIADVKNPHEQNPHAQNPNDSSASSRKDDLPPLDFY